MAANTDKLSELVAQAIAPVIAQYGIELPEFYIENISLPPAVEEALDKRTSMGMAGDLTNFARYSQAEAMTLAAKNQGSMGAGMGMMMGAGMPSPWGAPAATGAAQTPPPPPAGDKTWHIVVNGETAVWLQRASVFLIPPIVWLMLVSLAMRDGWRRWLIGGFAGFAGLLVFTQDFYTGAFALLVGALQFAGALPWLGRRVAGAWIAPLKPTGPSGRDARTGSAPSVAWLVISAVAALWAAAIWLHPIARVELGSTKRARPPRCARRALPSATR
jgi:hypothetical protein